MDKSIVDMLYGFLMSGGGANIEDLKFTESTMDFAEKVWGYLAILGVGLTLVYFLVEMNQKIALEGRDLNLKSFAAPFLKLFMAWVILLNGGSMVSSILGFYNASLKQADDWRVAVGGTEIVSTFKETTHNPTPSAEETAALEAAKAAENEDIEKIQKVVKKMSIFELIGILPIALIMWLLQMILKIVWGYKAITFKLEFLWKIGTTPVALADVYNGLNSNAFRWLKGLMATAVYGMSFVLIVLIGNDMVSGEFKDTFFAMLDGEAGILRGFTTLVKFIVIPFAELGVLGAIKQTTREAFG